MTGREQNDGPDGAVRAPTGPDEASTGTRALDNINCRQGVVRSLVREVGSCDQFG